ncbi:hypothetical protein ACFWP0_03780 [Achromobacter sp. NPDC058515]|uniref:hypothetical protein n=1 Tax=Achromobacter sp. NPDC058515 TaxID=3346533 RepID=UPI0036690B08
MRILTTAGLLLAFLLAGCTAPSSYSSDQPRSTSSMRSDPANYHSSRFGEQNNEPFQRSVPAR